MSEFVHWRFEHDAEDVTSGLCSRPVPALTCVVRAENLVHGSDQQGCSPGGRP